MPDAILSIQFYISQKKEPICSHPLLSVLAPHSFSLPWDQSFVLCCHLETRWVWTMSTTFDYCNTLCCNSGWTEESNNYILCSILSLSSLGCLPGCVWWKSNSLGVLWSGCDYKVLYWSISFWSKVHEVHGHGVKHFLNCPKVFLTDPKRSGWCLGSQTQCPTGACLICEAWCHRQVYAVDRIFLGWVNSGHWVWGVTYWENTH